MKLLSSFLLFLFLCSSCGVSQREKLIKEKEGALNNKQKELLLWEQQLTQRELSLEERERLLDSTKREIDSVVIHGPSVAGRWQVNMICVETSCDGSAIGDVKNEQWVFSLVNNAIVVKAYAGKNLSRIYNGSYTTRGLQLVDQNASHSSTSIEVTLRILNEGKMDGIREIKLPDCKTIYSITAGRL